MDPFQLHLHFCFFSLFSPFNNTSEHNAHRKCTVLSQETWSHNLPVKYRRHHVLANSRCLRSPCSLLFAQTVVNMELQVALKPLLPTQKMCVDVCMWFRACTFSIASSLSHSALSVKSTGTFVKLKTPDETSRKAVCYYVNLPSLVGLSGETTD